MATQLETDYRNAIADLHTYEQNAQPQKLSWWHDAKWVDLARKVTQLRREFRLERILAGKFQPLPAASVDPQPADYDAPPDWQYDPNAPVNP